MKKVYLFFYLCVTFCVSAQSPDLINYQGVVRSATGALLNDRIIRVHFELRLGSSTSSPVYQEDQPLQTNHLGLFNTQIGKINPGSFSAIDWQAGSYFLSVAIDTSGGINYTELGV